jgi:hypothetical protein
VANQDVLNVVVVEGIVERDGDAAGIAEKDIDAFAGEAFEQHFGAAHEFTGFDGPGRAFRAFGAGGLKIWGLHDFDLAPEKSTFKNEEATSRVLNPADGLGSCFGLCRTGHPESLRRGRLLLPIRLLQAR